MQLVSNALAQECAMGGLMMAYFMCVGWPGGRGTCSAVKQLSTQLVQLVGVGCIGLCAEQKVVSAKSQQQASVSPFAAA
jgi:hypothetical protein